MLMSNNTKLFIVEKIHRLKNILIFSLVLIFALQSLSFISIYQINFPYSMDYTGIDYLWDYVLTGNFPLEKFFATHSGHFLIFPRLVVLPNLIFNSFDITNLYYLQWIILSFTLYFIYLLLKQTDKRLLWLLIPISGFIYSPLTNSNYWAFAILQWYLPSLGIVITVYLLQKKLNFKIFISAISSAVLATFSVIAGIVAWFPWIIGIPYLNFIKNKTENKWLLLWILGSIATGLLYYLLTPQSSLTVEPTIFFKPDGYLFIATFVSAAFRLQYHILMIIVGTISIFISFYCVYYFIFINKAKNALPWLLFILVGIFSGIITALGRAHLDFHYGNEPYYVPLSQFVQIGLIVLVGLIILDLNKRVIKHKKLFVVILYVIIISNMILLSTSYYAGWWRGNYYYEEKTEFTNCFSLSHGSECVIQQDTKISPPFKSDLNFDLFNYWLDNKMNIFSDEKFNQQNKQALEEFQNIWYNTNEYNVGYGNIETINEVEASDKKQIIIENPFIIITGWSLDHNKKKLDSIFLIINQKPFLKYDDFQPRSDISTFIGGSADLDSGWQISFLTNYLEDGCHTLTFVGLKNNHKIIFDEEIQICKNYSTP